VAIADVYDALTSSRPYKIGFTHEKSMEIIHENAGTHFDPHLVEIFERHSDEVKTIASKTI
jgi:HD-GYP domain-containing protein (c-di-GMP phosphodiesterase class II)